jgi:hypothetical protein
MHEDTVLLEEPTFITFITGTYTTTVQYCAHCICLHLLHSSQERTQQQCNIVPTVSVYVYRIRNQFWSIILVALRARCVPNLMENNSPSFISVG